MKDPAEFAPYKINCHWSKSISVTYLSIADMRTTDINKSTKIKIMNTLAAKIDEDQVMNDSKKGLY